MSEEWLEKLQAGDTVGVQRSGMGGTRQVSFHKVSKITATQIVVLLNPETGAVDRFKRGSGREIGGSAWHHSWLTEATPELIAEIKAEKRRENIIYAIRQVSWHGLTTEDLERVYAVIKKPLTE